MGAVQDPQQVESTPVTIQIHARFIEWRDGAHRAVLPGTRVELIDAEWGTDEVLASCVTDDFGRVFMDVDPDEGRPDLYFRVGSWDSRDAFARHDPDRAGYWPDFTGQRIGPVTFDVSDTPDGPRLGNQVRALIDGHETLPALEALIDSAQSRLHIEVMFWFNDPIGRALSERVLARARAGVQVRLMFDRRTTGDAYKHINLRKVWVRGFVELSDAKRDQWMARLDAAQAHDKPRGQTQALIDAWAAEPNITFVDSSKAYVELDPQADADVPALYRELEDELPVLTAGRIDHRKVFIADGQRALLGGMNVGQEYLYRLPIRPELDAEADAASSPEPWVKWQDTMVQVQGPSVMDLERHFRERWVTEGGPEYPVDVVVPAVCGTVAAEVLDTTPGARQEFYDTTLELLAAAKRRVWVESAYFSSSEVVDALVAACARGVDVCVIFAGGWHNDSLDFFYAGRSFYERLLAAGARVIEVAHHMNHSKVMVVDDFSLIGTANLNASSFDKHYELCLLIDDAAFTDDFVQRRFVADAATGQRITSADGLMNITLAGKLWLRGVVKQLF